jgi:hypothetical protein
LACHNRRDDLKLALAAIGARHMDEPVQKRIERFCNISTQENFIV